jgi:hypothetical protein
MRIEPALSDRRLLPRVVVPGAFLCSFFCSPVSAEPFIGQFELKTLESAAGRFEFQSQNAWSQGEPARRMATGPDGIVFDENAVIRARHALELEIGFTGILKMRVGIEFEQERLDEPESIDEANDFDDLQLSELGVELIWVLSPRAGDGGGYGVVAEIERPVDEEESSSLILGPIIEFQSGRWFAAAVPMLVYAFGGDADEGEKVDNKWDFAYAAQLTYSLSPRWSLALEGYGTIERLGSSGHPSESAQVFGDFDQHRLGPVLYYTYDFGRNLGDSRRGAAAGSELLSGADEEEGASVTIGLGVLEGLNGNSADHTIKLSIEVDF